MISFLEAARLFKKYVPGCVEKDSILNGRCILCGDSQKNKSKKRLYLIKNDKGVPYVFCHNEGCVANTGISMKNFLKQVDEKEYKRFVFREINSREPEIEIKSTELKSKKRKSKLLREYLKKGCIPLQIKRKGKLEEIRKRTVKYLLDRMIPKKFIRTFYIGIIGKYKNMIIIPFLDEQGEPYYFQARGLTKKFYLFSEFSDLDKPDLILYNKYHIDPFDTVYICEGTFDSMFLKNSVALCGISKFNKKALSRLREKYDKRIFVVDNDSPGRSRANRILAYNERVYIPHCNCCKDINDMMLHHHINIFEEIDNYVLEGITGLMQLSFVEQGLERKRCMTKN